MARGVKVEPNSSRGDQGWRSVSASNDPPIQQPQSQPQKQRRERHPSQIPRQEQQQNEPEQDVAQRRAIRRRFRDVKNLINEERDEIYRPGSDKFDCIITEVQKLHEQVHKPREQVADAEALLDITNNLLNTVKAHKCEGFTPGDFINSLIRDFGKQVIANDSTDGSGYTLLWKEVGLAVSHVLKRAPGCCTMLGPMSVEMKQKKRRTVVRTKRGSAEKERPEELSNKKEEMTDTDKNMVTMFDILKKNRKAPLENLILNRNYFAQTVENLFALSFLVKDGRAEITVDKDGNHFVSPKNAPAANAVASGQVSYCHFVFRFDFKDWKLMLNTVMEGEELMPHRELAVEAGQFKYSTQEVGYDEHQAGGIGTSTTPIRKRSRNRGLVIQEQPFVEDSPDAGDGAGCSDLIRGKRGKII